MTSERRPLSAAQESIWLEQVVRPDVTNCGFFAVTAQGPVSADAIRRTCLAITARHPALRSTVAGEGPGLLVHPSAATLRFATFPVPCQPGEERVTSRAWHSRQPLAWDITTEPPIRFSLLDHGGDRCTLMIDVHHIGFDGRSKFVFAREFCKLLTVARLGGLDAITDDMAVAPAPEPPVAQADIESAADYWLSQQIQQLPGMLLPAVETAQIAGMASTDVIDVPVSTCELLARLARAEGTTFFGALLAALSAQLWVYGNGHAVFAITADTSTARTRDDIGLQVNVVPCLVRLPPAVTFRDLIRAAGTSLSHVARYRHLPIHLMLRRLRQRTGADVAQSRFGSLSVSYPRMADDLGNVPGLTLQWDMFAPNSSRSFDLILQLRRLDTAAFGRLDYSTAVFDAATAQGFMSMFCAALQLANAPDEPLRPRGAAKRPTMRAGSGSAPTPASAARSARVVCTVAEAVITAGDLAEAIDQVHSSRARRTEPVTVPAPHDRDSVLTLLAALEGGLPVMVLSQERGFALSASDGLLLTPRWAASQRQAAPALQEALDSPSRVINMHRPGSAAFAGVLLRGLASDCHVVVLSPHAGSAAIEIADLPHDTVVAAPLGIARSLAVGQTRPDLAARIAVVMPMSQFLPCHALESFAERGGRILLHLGDETSGLLGWSLLGDTRRDDSWSLAPRIEHCARELVVVGRGRALPDGVPGLLAVTDGPSTASSLASDSTPYRAWMKNGALRYLGLAADQIDALGAGVTGPESAERLLARIPGVSEAGVAWNDRTGRFAIAVVLADQMPTDAAAEAAAVDHWRGVIRRGWPHRGLGAVPRQIRLMRALPRTVEGEINRSALAGLMHH